MNIRLSTALLLMMSTPLWAATPASGTLTIHETEIEFTNGPIVGVNPTPFIEDQTGLICNPGLDCDRFDLTVDVPEGLLEVFPTAILRMNIQWEHPTGQAVEDYDFYAYDEAGNQIGSSADLNSGANTLEAIALGVRPGVTNIRLDIIYFLVLGSSYTGHVELDLGPASDEADVDAFFADNPPTDSFFISPELDMQDPEAVQSRSAAGAGGGSLGGQGLVLLALLGLARRTRLR